MGLLDCIQSWLARSRGSSLLDDGMADHTVTLAQQAMQRWQFMAMREEQLDYIRGCIGVLTADRREEIEQAQGKEWRDSLRKRYGMDEHIDGVIRSSWQVMITSGKAAKRNPEPFVHHTFEQHLSSLVTRQLAAIPIRTAEAIAESYQRKLRSEKRLREAGVPVNLQLPVMESSSEVTLRDLDMIRKRAFVLAWVARAFDSELEDRAEIMGMLAVTGMVEELSPSEQSLLLAPVLTEDERQTLLWMFDAARALLWSLGLLDMADPLERCDAQRVFDAAASLSSAKESLCELRLRPVHEILDEWDYSYRFHWAVKDALLHASQEPRRAAQSPAILTTTSAFFDGLMLHGARLFRCGALPMVVSMRHHALNWLLGWPAKASILPTLTAQRSPQPRLHAAGQTGRDQANRDRSVPRDRWLLSWRGVDQITAAVWASAHSVSRPVHRSLGLRWGTLDLSGHPG